MDIALITGANKGIGYEVARQLAEGGMHVLLGARDPERGEAAAAKLRAEGLTAVSFLQLDVTDTHSITAAVATIKERFGHLDVLINNAGIAVEREGPATATLEAMRRTYDTNVFGVVAVTQAFLPLLRESANARIVNVSSGLGSLTQHSDPDWEYNSIISLAYCSSKSALNSFTVLLAKELAGDRIQVNAADPGYTATDLNGNSGPQTVAEGSEAIVSFATAAPGSPSGTYRDRHGVVPW